MIRRLLTPSFVLFSCFIIGGMLFRSHAPRTCGEIFPDDSIFVLTGDERRIPFAMHKLDEYPNVDLYIIGAGATSIETTRPAIIESKSKSTYQNALAIKKIATERALERVVVITTEDHMNRATHLIQSELPNTQIIACPAILTGMPPSKRLERWATEYIKYIVTMIGIKES
ncbi:MAG: YdcF family protein [Alphaproteobacteria bacterium]|nr:YdcF family protein [Alphaproteobacteria bacterium]